MSDWKFYLFLTITCIIIQGFFAMIEMACISFNKVRLHYWASQGHLKAKWLSRLMQRPALLFGTTLIGVNTALQLGSEASRRFYETMGLNPDLAPISQILLVLIFAELAPMFAGRRYSEHVAMIGTPIIYLFSIFLRPLIFFFDLICRVVNRLFKSPTEQGIYLSREELQHMFEKREEEKRALGEVNTVVTNIFSLKKKRSKEIMSPLNEIQMIPSFCTIGEMQQLLHDKYTPYLPIYQKHLQQIIGIAYPRDLIRLDEYQKVRDHARPAWFITEHLSALEILKQFRRNNHSVAIVLNEIGQAVGILTLDRILDEIFGRQDDWEQFEDIAPRMHHVIVDRTFVGDLTVKEFNEKFSVHLPADPEITLEDLMEEKLGHLPEEGESIRIDQFELTVEQAAMLGPKKIAIRTIY